MAIDKALYQAPVGIEAAQAEPELEIEIEDPESVTLRTGGVEIEIEPGKETPEEFSANLAEFMDERDLASLAETLSDEITNDLNSRKDWEKMLKDGIQLLGLKYEERTEPWPGACGVFHPMITEAVVRFQSDTIMETFPAAGPVKTKIVGKQTREKDEAARRVGDDLNWQLTENMVEFRPEHERMLWNLPGAGSAFKKVYRDPVLQRQTSVFVPAEDVILPYGASDLLTCPRVTHRMRYDKQMIDRLQYDGMWRDIDVGPPPRMTDELQKRKDEETGFSSLNDTRYIIYEAAVDLDLKGFEDKDKHGEPTGIALPYVVTMVYGTNLILAIRRNWREEDDTRQKRLHYVHYQYIPGYGAYGFGLFHLIGGFAKSATSIMRQLVDAGTLSNLPGGLKTRGLRIKGDDTPIAPGEFRDVDVGSGAIRDNIMPLPYKEPSMVLSGLLDKIVDEGRRFAATSDMKIADMSNQAPVGSTLAILERSLKVMSAVQARVHFSFKQELKLIAELVREDVPDGEEYAYDVDAPNGRKAKYSDYRHVEIIPVSDPNAATMSQRVVQYQAVLQLATTAPQIYDLPELHKQMLHVLGIKNIEKLIPTKDDMKPKDPVQENQDVLTGKPLKAFAYQDHEAHIKVHTMAAQDPVIQQLIGQNPQAQAIMAALQAHIAEHVGFAYRNRISVALGAPLPAYKEDEGLPPEMEYQVSQMLAQAAPQVLAQSQAQVAQQQAQQNAQDPIIQMQQQELQLKAKEVDIKQKKVLADAAAKADELRLKEQEFSAKYAGQHQEMQANAARMQQEQAGRAAQMIHEHEGQQAEMIRENMRHQAQMERDAQVHEFNQHKARTTHDETLRMNRERHAQQMEMQRAAKKQAGPKKEPNK
jgi:hypothetical protein